MTGGLRPHMAELVQNLPNDFWLAWSQAGEANPSLAEAVMSNDLEGVLRLLKEADYEELAEKIAADGAASQLPTTA